MAHPEQIWLIDTGDDVAWCDHSDPTGETDPRDTTQYIRADIVNKRIKALEAMVQEIGADRAKLLMERNHEPR